MSYYRRNEANHSQIVDHFDGCSFEPKLETYVDVDPYVKKILGNAERFEYWVDNELAGLVAVYCNDFKSHEAFITMVSVMTKYGGRGVAKKLLDQAIYHCKELDFARLKLEVLPVNTRAIKIYESFGFEKYDKSGNLIKMELRLK